MTQPPKKSQHVCPSCGRHIPEDQRDMAEEQGKCPFCGKPVIAPKRYDPDAEIIVDRDEIDEEERSGS